MLLPVASFDAEMRVRVHVAALEEGVGADGAAEVLGSTSEEIFSALALSENTGFCADFYEQVRSEFGSVHYYIDELGNERSADLPPRAEIDQPRQVEAILTLNYITVGQLEISPLPRKDLVLPVSDLDFRELQNRFEYASTRTRTLNVYDVSNQEETLDRLAYYVRKLEARLNDASRLTREHGSTLGAVSKARTVVLLQERHWWSEERKARLSKNDYEARRDRLIALDGSLEQLGDELAGKLREPHDARQAGRALLKILHDRDAAQGGVPALVEVLAVARWNLSAKTRRRLIDLLARAVAALSLSPVAEKFLGDHGLDLLESLSELDPEFYDTFIAGLRSHELALEMRSGWRVTLKELRDELGAPTAGSSPFAWVGKIAKRLRSAMSLGKALLTPTVVAILASSLMRRSRSGYTSVGRKLSAVALRALTTGSVMHMKGPMPSAPKELDFLNAVARATDEATILKIVDEADAAPAGEKLRRWREAGKEIADVGLDSHYTRKPGFYGSAVAFSMIALVASLASDEDDPFIYATALLGGVLGAAQAVAGASPFLLATPDSTVASTSQLKGWDRTANNLGRAAAAIGIVTSVAILYRDTGQASTGVLLTDWLNVGAGGLTGLAWLLEFSGAVGLAASFGTAAAVVGVAALTVGIIVEVVEPGPRAVVRAYLGHVEDDDVGALLPIETARVRELMDAVSDADAFEDFKWFEGRKGIDPRHSSPSVFGAWSLGLSHIEISKVFSPKSFLGRPLAAVKALLPTEADLRGG